MYTRILLTTDFSPAARRLQEFVVSFAQVMQSEIFLLHVDEEESYFGARSSTELIHFFQRIGLQRDQWMENLAEDIEAAGVPCTQVRAKGIASDEILRHIEMLNVDMVAFATVGIEGAKRVLLGSTSRRLLLDAPCAVLSVNPRYAPPPAPSDEPKHRVRRILFPFDGSPTARAGAPRAYAVAQKLGAALDVLHILKVPTLIPSLPGEPPISLPVESLDGLRDENEEAIRTCLKGLGVTDTEVAVTIGSDEAEAIVDYATANEVDLIVIARRFPYGVRGMFGRVAHAVVKLSDIPVLSLRFEP